MYDYTRKKKKLKKKTLLSMSMVAFLALSLAGVSYLAQQSPKEETPVIKEEVTIPVISLPQNEEKAIRPYKVDAKIVLDYYDGNTSEVNNMTKFEGTYRANQGIDYAFENQEFDVLSILSGEVSDVQEDPLFGYSCTITSGDISITYQSLKDMKKVVGDKVGQSEPISLASTNIYNKELENHLHIVVEYKGERMDPETLYGVTLSELK